MMVPGTSGLVPNSDIEPQKSDGGGIGGGFSEECSGGNRWPRQETMALLKIRSDMDVAFRDSGLKGPLWEDVSRKLAELGYHRSGKKCKEKFENVYKYHKRTKDGRTTKADGKTYRFFEQLEALDTHPSFQLQPQPLTIAPPPPPPNIKTIPIVPQITIPLIPNPSTNPTNSPPQPMIVKSSSIPTESISPPFYQSNSNSTSSTSSDEQPDRGRKRKRVWKDFFGRLMKEVIEKQEELQKNFLEALEKRERERMIREEAWRMQEMAKMNREHEILVRERSMSAAKDAAVISFLQKVTEQQSQQQNLNVISQIVPVQNTSPQPPLPPPPQPKQQSPPPPQQKQSSPPQPKQQSSPPLQLLLQPQDNNGSDSFMTPSPSRWPKAEIEALIRLRTTLDMKYQENAPKGPLWEEISLGMRSLGYNRNSKRCKEKWENINKYYKKVKESNKKRPEDAKTCPYFHQLEAIYKAKTITNHGNGGTINIPNNPTGPIMVRPEQQWPNDHNVDVEEDTCDEDEEDDDGTDGYEIVTNKVSTMAANE